MTNEKVHTLPFNRLHGHLKGVIERYAFYFTGSKQYVEDTAQEVFIKMWLKWPMLSELTDNELEDYVYVMTSNLLINEQKLLKRKRKYLNYKSSTVPEIYWHDPVIVEEGFYIYRQAVKGLPTKEQRVYYFYEKGYSRQQIAQEVKRSPNTVNNQLYTASKTVKEFLGRYLEFTIEMDGRRRFWNGAALN